MASSRSKCRTCGEKIVDSGNFQLKILKAKDVPLKLQKLLKTGKLDEGKKDILRHTRFGKFLLKRAISRNVIEITCGNCSSSSQIIAKKPSLLSVSALTSTTTHPSELEDSRRRITVTTPMSTPARRKRKRGKDANAGLTIPSSMSMSTGNEEVSTYEFKSDHASGSGSTPKRPQNAPSTKPVLSKEKEMENLRKVLFKSKKRGQGQHSMKKTSLKDFLSSMM